MVKQSSNDSFSLTRDSPFYNNVKYQQDKRRLEAWKIILEQKYDLENIVIE